MSQSSNQSDEDMGIVYSENPWLYADEASLYSIEENSREESAADDFSPTPKQAVSPSRSYATSNGSTNGDEVVGSDASGDIGVEIRFEEDDDNLTKVSDDQFLFYDTSQRRCRMLTATCLLTTFLVAIVLSVTLSQQNQSRSSGSVSSITNGSPNTVETDRPSESPSTFSPTIDTSYVLSENYVYDALKQCQGTGSFFEAATSQGSVFQSLVQEVHDETIVDATGDIAFAKLHSAEYLREKFALSMLYITTNGDSWSVNDNWMSTSDPCVDWSGIVCANNRTESSCAVTGIELASNGLSGELPVEFCCMPCVEEIKMSYNEIGGDILMCLVGIPTLDKIDFSGNVFGRPSNSSSAVVTARSNDAVSTP